jgi:phosphoglycerol transferase MdoB-like AlkP superfamily enzyme
VWQFLQVMVYGIRFDISAIIYINLPLIFFHILPNPFREKAWYQAGLKFLFYSVNFFALAYQFSDFAYFKYERKRLTADIFAINGDMKDQFPEFVKNFWYLFALMILTLILIEYLYRKIKLSKVQVKINYPAQILLMIVVLVFCVIGVRGGLQKKPITPTSASDMDDPYFASLIQNTPFTLLFSYNESHISDAHYLPKQEADSLFNMRRQTNFSFIRDKYNITPKHYNVVLIIVESLSKEYIGYYNNGSGYTPFLDSLMRNSLVCMNAFANAKRSIEGVPAVLSSLPTLMVDPPITSLYSKDHLPGIAGFLKKLGYSSAFFHGGFNGSMNFDFYTPEIGFDKYYGKAEYNNDKDFDNAWGIYDEPYLQYYAQTMNTMKQPFCTAVFTISTHHPYGIPEKWKGKLKSGNEPVYQTVSYFDKALREFFKTASTQPWFDNTLFVITADHSGPAYRPKYETRTGIYNVPLVFYLPGSDLKGIIDHVTQQVDVLPTVLDILNYPDPYYAFGKSVFDSSRYNYAFSYLDETYQLSDDNYSLIFDGQNPLALYKYKTDTLEQDNLINTLPAVQQRMEKQIKAVIQSYNYAFIHNQLVIQ